MITSFHLILENARKRKYNIAKEVEEFMDFFQKYPSIEELKEKYKGKEKFKGMVKKVEELTQDEDFLMYYDLEEKHKHEKQSSYELGIQEGSKQKEIEIAKKLKELDLPNDKIAKATDLSEEEIKNLK